MSDWMMSKICDNILSEIHHHYVTPLFIGWCLVLRHCHRLTLVNNKAFWNEEKLEKVHYKGDNCTENCHLGRCPQCYGLKLRCMAPLTHRCKTKIKPTIYLPIWQFWRPIFIYNIYRPTMTIKGQKKLLCSSWKEESWIFFGYLKADVQYFCNPKYEGSGKSDTCYLIPLWHATK